MGNDNKKNSRPPVVSVLGHIDHGKTTLLDYIKKTKVAEGEEGGITQHINAYEIEHEGNKITFIDTPGHHAFSKMRSRGAQVSDIALLVVSANSGVELQTKEALKFIREAEIPYIVVASKTDLEKANIKKMKGELQKQGVELEEWGGDIPFVETSAKKGEGIKELLDVISLVADLSELSPTRSKELRALIIEAHLSGQKGPVVSAIVKSGLLEVGNDIVTGLTKGRVKRLDDFQGNSIEVAEPSQPVSIIGLEDLPEVGELIEKSDQSNRKEPTPDSSQDVTEIGPEQPSRELSLVLKSDVKGTKSALIKHLKNAEIEKTKLKIVYGGTGKINDSDLDLASTLDGAILGFRVGLAQHIKKRIQRQNIPINTFDVVYKVEDILEEFLDRLFPPEKKRIKQAKVKILETFGPRSNNRNIIGGKVLAGTLKKGNVIKVIRNKKKVGEGKLVQLRREDKEVEEVKKGQKCGMMFKGPVGIKKGDRFQALQIKESPPSL